MPTEIHTDDETLSRVVRGAVYEAVAAALASLAGEEEPEEDARDVHRAAEEESEGVDFRHVFELLRVHPEGLTCHGIAQRMKPNLSEQEMRLFQTQLDRLLKGLWREGDLSRTKLPKSNTAVYKRPDR